MQNWQKEHPLAKASVRNPERAKKLLWQSGPLDVKGRGDYRISVFAEWGDKPTNGSNVFYLKVGVYTLSGRESDFVCLEDVPAQAALIPPEILALKKWNGCHSAGPWYYIENTLFHAGDCDCHGLRKGESKQIISGRSGLPSWKRTNVDATGKEVDRAQQYADGLTPPANDVYLKWIPWCRVGEGKERELDYARSTAIWLDATDEDLTADGLRERLVARHPALMQEFHDMIVGLGFTW